MYRVLSKAFAMSAATLATLAGVTFGSTVLASADTTASNSSNKTLLALGDSITFGYNLSDTNNNTVPSKSAFPMIIGQDDHLNVSNLGVPGWTTFDLLTALQSPNFARAVQGASAITLDIGSNDLLHAAAQAGLLNQVASKTPVTLTAEQQQAFTAAVEQVGKNLSAIVAGIRTQTTAPILLYNLYDPFPDASAIHAPTEQFETAVDSIINQIATANKNVVVVDAHAAFNHNQMTYVRVAEQDIHPTTLGQSVLAKLGEAALQPLWSDVQAKSKGVTSQIATGFATSGGTLTGTLNGSTVSLTVPNGALNEASEVDVTASPVSDLKQLVPTSDKAAAEAGVNFMSSVTLSSPYTLTIANPAITANSAVYAIENGKLVAVPNAKVQNGQAVIPGTTSADYVVLSPVVAAVPGGTQPKTGLPFTSQAFLAVALLAAGGALIYASRRKQKV